MRPRRALVTGASGFVGANLVRRLQEAGHQVGVIVRPDGPQWRLQGLAEPYTSVADDILAPDLSARIRDFSPDWVFHLATYGAYPWQGDMRLAAQTNFTGTVNLLEACLAAGFEVFVNTGSSSEYGPKDHAPSEDEALAPNSYYSVTKAASTLLCRHVAQSTGARVVTLRLYSVYGPFEEPARLIPSLLKAALANRLPPLADPRTARDYLHVDDACAAFMKVAATPVAPGAVLNVGTGRQTTLRELVDLVRRLFGVGVEPRWGSFQSRPWDTDVWVSDVSRIQEAIGWSAGIDLEAGLLQTARWLRANGAAPAIARSGSPG